MDPLFWGLTLGFLGKLLLGLSVLLVHSKIVHEHKIDRAVLLEMRHEQTLAIIGIILMAVGYTLELGFYEFILLPSFFSAGM